MALSDKEISALYFEALGSQHLREQDRKMVTRFAHAVESEVRTQDDALIQQLVEALEGYRRNHNDTQPCDAERAGRARLECKP